MKKRLLTGIAMIAFVILLFFIRQIPVAGLYLFDVLLTVGIGYGAYEMSKLLKKMGFHNNMIVCIAFPAILLLSLLLSINAQLPLYAIILIELGVILMTAILLFTFNITFRRLTKNEIILRKSSESINMFSLKNTINTLITFIYPTFFFMFFIFINHFNDFSYELSNISKLDIASLVMLITALLVPMFTDTFAMLTGSLIGGKKLCPKISPNKTISGAIGGTLFAVLLSSCVYLIMYSIPSCFDAFMASGFYIWKYIIIVFIASIISQLGDLFESIIKRRAGVKDSGNLLPGHGGLLDRIDSYIYTAPIIFISFIIMLL